MPRTKRKPIGLRTRFAVLQAGGFCCHYCGRRAGPNVVLQIDHRLPVAAGGTNERANLVASCTACNQGKGDARPTAGRCIAEQHPGPFTLEALGPTDAPGRDTAMVCEACRYIVWIRTPAGVEDIRIRARREALA